MFNAVFHNDTDYAKRWLASGGNPNAKNEQGESLLYVATGPKVGRNDPCPCGSGSGKKYKKCHGAN